MRALADADRIRALMRELGRAAAAECRVYFTGGATAVLLGWRRATVDADIQVVPDSDALLRELPELKERLQINIELVAPSDFIPELPGWQDRSAFIERVGPVSFLHYDFYAQALAKIERGHAQDRADVSQMIARGLVESARLAELFEAIFPTLYRYPAIDPAAFRAAVAAVAGRGGPAWT